MLFQHTFPDHTTSRTYRILLIPDIPKKNPKNPTEGSSIDRGYC